MLGLLNNSGVPSVSYSRRGGVVRKRNDFNLEHNMDNG
jgi:hypothetical protein